MSDSEQGPLSAGVRAEEKRNWLPMAMGAALVLVIIAIVVLAGKAGKSSGNAGPNDPNLARVQVSDLHMATAQNFAGNSVTYIEGRITNASDRRLTAVRVEVIFKNALGETAQKEVLPVAVLLRSVPYVDYGSIDSAPLAPGQSRDFRLTLEHVSADWNGQIPQVKAVSVGY